MMPVGSFTDIPARLKLYVLFCNFLFTAFIPILMMILLKKKQLIDSIYLDRSKERVIPLVMTILFCTVNIYFISGFHDILPGFYFYFLIASLFSLLISFLVNFKSKISLHMVGMGGVTGSLFIASYMLGLNLSTEISVFFTLAGITGTSRMLLGAHSLFQVIIGFIIGILPQITFFFL